MSIEHMRAEVISSVWKAIAQSEVDLSNVSTEGQEAMVANIADNVMLTIDGLLEEGIEDTPQVELTDGQEEDFIWKGRPFLSLVENYLITSERIKIVTGLIGREVENYELIRIQDIDYKQGFNERIFGIGDVTIRGHDASDPKFVLRNVSNPEEVYEILRKAWLEARKRHGLEFREFM